ncbi:MAG: metal ABC transporter ATP-binding protein [Verrucomicrobiota bacterium]|nr:metal ABC transporter ATP-binding protein [Verrucomicrobiota bacterium]MEE2734856.1 metal ABC transporter ATP-binding protein [Verrucomicrobiota bacterium]
MEPENHSRHDCCAHHDHHHELVIDNVGVAYGPVPALHSISLATSCGNRVALIGPNGAGKSTLLKAIAGLVPRKTGTIQWRGTAVQKWSREFAYLPQREEVDWNFPITVRGLVEMGRFPHLGLWKRYSDNDDKAVDHALQILAIADLQDRQICELSGGQQQRAFLARALAQEAHVLLLDEPFTGLDRNASESLANLLAALSEEGRLILSSHHDLDSAPDLFNECLLLNHSQFGFGPTPEILTPQLIAEAFTTPDPASDD